MKRNEVNFFHKHVEKLILVVGLIGLVAVVWVYVLNNPYAVDVGHQTSVQPAQVEQQVLNELRLLRQQIAPGTPSPLPEMAVPAYTAMFRHRVQLTPLPQAAFDPLGALGLAHAHVPNEPPPQPGAFDPPVPPAPLRVEAHPGFGVLLNTQQLAQQYTESVLDQQGDRRAKRYGQEIARAYGAMVQDKPPRDFRYVTVVGYYDLEAWRKKLSSGAGTIPEEWWQDMLAFTDVMLRREAFDPVTGQWQAATVIQPLPGALSFRASPQSWTTIQAQDAVEAIKLEQDKILRPPFAPMTQEVVWHAPQEAPIELSEEDRQKIEQFTTQINQLEQQIKSISNPAQPKEPSQEELFELGDQWRLGGADQEQQPDSPTDQDLQQLEQQLKEKNQQLNDLLDELGVSRGDGSLPIATGEPGSHPSWLRIWAHDITAKPGAIYRYQLQVSLLNPLFQRAQLTGEQRQRYFHQLAVNSAPSAWTKQVPIEPAYRFFVVAGSGVEQEVTVEVWRVFNGQPRMAEFRVHPGDPVGRPVVMQAAGQDVEVDMRVGALVVDLTDVPSTQDYGARTTQMLYLDVATNQLHERTVEIDRASPHRAKLMNQDALKSAVAEAAGLAGRQ